MISFDSLLSLFTNLPSDEMTNIAVDPTFNKIKSYFYNHIDGVALGSTDFYVLLPT